MQISKETLEPFSVDYPVVKLGDPEKLLFLDIETTGFTAKTSSLYMIGCAYYRDGHWCTIQWLADNYDEESSVLGSFCQFANDFEYLVHFNGNQFDIPFLTQKSQQLGLDDQVRLFERMKGIDLYKRISPCKNFLQLSNCKQRTLEQFLGIDRTDTFTGGELIGIYHDYVQTPSDFSRNSLFLHNEDDLKGMLLILPMLTYYDIFNDDIRVKKVQANSYRDLNDLTRQEVVMTIALPGSLPKPVSLFRMGCYFKADGDECVLKVPLYVEEMKYFYLNYHDYYYLPEEDVALHKSIATFVDKEHRTQATAATCYTRKASQYLPQWERIFEPVFRREYRSHEIFFELTDDMKRDRAAFTQYAKHVLSVLGSNY